MNSDVILHGRIFDKLNFSNQLIPPFPKKNMLIEITNFCNHKCVFCFNSHMTRKRGFIKKKLAIRVLEEAYSLGTREVGFYATGEPLLNRDLSDYIRYAKSIGFSYVYLTTNGALLTNEKATELLDAGVDSVKFSINAGTPKTYAQIHGKDDFERVLKNLILFDQYRKRYNHTKLFVSYIVNRLNICEKESFSKLVAPYADDVIFLNMINQGGLMYQEVNALKIDVNKTDTSINMTIPCFQLFNALTISYEGYLTACCVDFQNYLAVADLNYTSLQDAWGSKKFQDLRRQHLSRDVKGTICFNCAYNQNQKCSPIEPSYAVLLAQS